LSHIGSESKEKLKTIKTKSKQIPKKTVDDLDLVQLHSKHSINTGCIINLQISGFQNYARANLLFTIMGVPKIIYAIIMAMAPLCFSLGGICESYT
jgi:hypothetical protein